MKEIIKLEYKRHKSKESDSIYSKCMFDSKDGDYKKYYNTMAQICFLSIEQLQEVNKLILNLKGWKGENSNG